MIMLPLLKLLQLLPLLESLLSRQLHVQSNNRNIRSRSEICSKLTIKTPERYEWHPSGVFMVNFEHISHLVLVFLLVTLCR